MNIRDCVNMDKYTYGDFLKIVNTIEDINDLSGYGRSLLHDAISSKKWDMASDLIDRGIDVNLQDEYGSTVLHYIADMPIDMDIAKKVLDAGGNPNIKDKNNQTAFYSLVGNMNDTYMENGIKYSLMELLLKYGADKTIKCPQDNAMELAEIIEDERAIEIMGMYQMEKTINKYQQLIESISWDKAMKFEFEDFDDAILLSAPSAYVHDWNCNYLEIDNVPLEYIEEELKNMSVSSKNDLAGFLNFLEQNSSNGDYLDFVNSKENGVYPEIESEDGKYAFTKCCDYALQFQPLVEDRGFIAWDSCETISIIRIAFSCGIIDRNEAEMLIKPIWNNVVELFDDWKEYAISFICGGAYEKYKNDGFGTGDFDEMAADKRFFDMVNVVKDLLDDSEYWGD